MSWDPFQREVLAELGHVIYWQVGTDLARNADAVVVDLPGTDGRSMDGVMLAHVAHAAGMTTEALQACIGDMDVITSLHGNASAKRALWPRLRSLRRQQG